MDEAQKPIIYEWVEEKEEAAKLPGPPKVKKPEKTYDEKLVAFIDVLGMTEKNLGLTAEQLLTLMGEFEVLRGQQECDPLTEHVKFLQLGDGFTIVADLNCINELCEALLFKNPMACLGVFSDDRPGIQRLVPLDLI